MRSLHSLLDPATMPFGRRRHDHNNSNPTSPTTTGNKKNKVKLAGWSSRATTRSSKLSKLGKQSVAPLASTANQNQNQHQNQDERRESAESEAKATASALRLQQLEKQQQLLRQKNRLLHEVVTTTSCHERLHLVLSPRRTSSEWKQVLDELRLRHSWLVKTVCVYTDDSPLSSAACNSSSSTASTTTTTTGSNATPPSSSRSSNNAALLLSMTRICHYMTTLQLDFSSEFQLPLLSNTTFNTSNSNTNPYHSNFLSLSNQANVLECNGLADILQQAPQLHTLSLRDVRLIGCPAQLKRALLTHPNLHTLEVKWCSTVETSQLMRMRMNEESDYYPSYFYSSSSSSEEEEDDDEKDNRETILAAIIHAMCDMPHLQEVTLLLSSTHELPLSQLAGAPNSIKKLTLGLEQRHVTTAQQLQLQNQQQQLTIPAAAVAAAQRYQDQQALLDFLQTLATCQEDGNLQDLTIISHHWKPKATLPILTRLIANSTSKLQSLSITDYNGYGSDHPHEIHDLIAALENNTCLRDVKIVTKKRMATAIASSAAAAAAAVAANSTTQQQTTQQHITTANPKGRRQVQRALYHAMANCLAQRNYTLASIELVHAGVSMVHTNTSSSSTSSSSTTVPTVTLPSMFEYLYPLSSSSSIPSSLSQKNLMAKNPDDRQYYQNKAMVPLYLQANAVQARQIMWNASSNNTTTSSSSSCCNNDLTKTTKNKSDAAAVLDFLMQHKDNTPLIYYMLQGNPQAILSLILLPITSTTTSSSFASGDEQEADKNNPNDESRTSFPTSDWECYY